MDVRMKPETYMVLITLFSILVMGTIVVLAVARPSGIFGAGVGQGTITVSAEGFAYGYPQQAYIYVSLNGSGQTASIAATNASLTLQRLNFSVERYLGGNLSRIKTTSYQLYRVHNSSAYEVYENLQLLIPNVDNLSYALANVSGISNVYVSSVSPVLSDYQISNMRSQALAAALENATSQASILAHNASVTQHNITVDSYTIMPLAYTAYGSSSPLPSPEQGLVYYTGRNEVSESITATFSYK